jgi:mono/diheme cytochrome c family protein
VRGETSRGILAAAPWRAAEHRETSMKLIVTIAVAVFVLGASAGAQDAKKIEAGKKVYEAQKCATCHMIAGKGNKMFPLDGVGSKLSSADIKSWITHPADMEAKLPKPPTMKMSSRKYNLKDADLDALVAYLESLKK